MSVRPLPAPRPATRASAPIARRAWACTLVGAVTVLAACGDQEPAALDDSRDLGARSDSAATWQPTEGFPVTITLDAPAQVRGGEPTPVRLRVHNGSIRPISIGFRTGREESYEVLIAKDGGVARDSVVWSSVAMQADASTTTTLTDPVRPGRDTVLTTTWPGTDDTGFALPPGRYRVRASVAAELFDKRRLWTDWQPLAVVR
jgi:hypothetical protein